MALVITIKVAPSAGKSGCTIDKNGALKCSLKSPPEGGKANNELIKLIAKKLDLTLDHVSIIRGQTARTKTIRIETLQTEQDVRHILCDGIQLSIT